MYNPFEEEMKAKEEYEKKNPPTRSQKIIKYSIFIFWVIWFLIFIGHIYDLYGKR
ncbi:MAG: hypothetical protein WCO35_02620 [Candidatus Nomurabacteria bacterium]